MSVEILDWDSKFFGATVARVGLHRPTIAQLSQAVDEADRQRVDCLYWLVDSDDPCAPRAALTCGFRLVDVRVTLERELGSAAIEANTSSGVSVRAFRPTDLPLLLPITSVSHDASRFFYDGNFSKERCAALYAKWLEKGCVEQARGVLVAEVEGRPAGYCICSASPDGLGVISLLAVDSRHRRLGVGTELVLAALEYFEVSGARAATVVTQARNIGSQRLYQRCGFLTRSVHLWYHRWRSEVV